MFLIPPIRSSTSGRYNKLITLIIFISEVMPSYSYYIKKGLVYIIIIAPSVFTYSRIRFSIIMLISFIKVIKLIIGSKKLVF